ncbi:hypothetical protein ABZ772_10680 [Streptomyces griseoincarnatus]
MERYQRERRFRRIVWPHALPPAVVVVAVVIDLVWPPFNTLRQVAEAVQRAMLPTVPERVRGLAMATGTRPRRWSP